VVFWLIPLELYLPNAVEWGNDFYLPQFFMLVGTALFVITMLLYWGLLRRSKWLSLFLPKWLFLLGIIILLCDLLSPVQLSLLDGSKPYSDQPLFNTLLELCIFLAIVLCGFLFRGEKSNRIYGELSIIFLFICVGYFSYALINNSKDDQLFAVDEVSEVNQQLPNVYHFHLDAMQTDYFLSNLQDSKREEDFKGFTVFKQNIANYPYSAPSIASYLTGTTYKSGDYRKWLSQFDQGLFKDAVASGYQLTIYGKPALLQTRLAKKFISGDSLYKLDLTIRHPLLQEYVRIWFARVMPNRVTNRALDIGEKIGNRLSQSIEKSLGTDKPINIKTGIEPYTGVLMLRDIIGKEKLRTQNGRYLFAQPILPHGPYVINKQCEYDQAQAGKSDKYMEQVECATSLLIKFLDELKALGRYDDSLIIVHSDHGSGWAGFLDEKEGSYISSLDTLKENPPFRAEFHPWGKENLEARAMALLMIKPPKSTSAFNVREENTELLDIYPTVSELLGFPESDIKQEGVSLVECLNHDICLEDFQRQLYFYYFKPGPTRTKEVEKIQVEFDEVGRPRFK
jgi:hypothetical protein